MVYSLAYYSVKLFNKPIDFVQTLGLWIRRTGSSGPKGQGHTNFILKTDVYASRPLIILLD